MKKKWRILKIFITVIILGFLLSFSLKRFSQKSVQQIAVNLQQSPVFFIDEKDIRTMVKNSNPSNKIGELDIPKLEKQIRAVPAVDSANVYLDLSGRLNLDIRQRVPVFRLNNGDKDIYVDEKGTEFPLSRNYAHTCMLVTGPVKPEEYVALAELVKKINRDPFSSKFFIGISKENGNYNLFTSDGNYKVEIGDLENIEFKVKGFKAFVEKFLVYQNPGKYSKISVKYDNQIVTTLNAHFEENDSILAEARKKIQEAPVLSRERALAAAQKRLKASNKK